MTKRILEIVTFPFYLLFLFLSFPFKIIKIILNDKRDMKKGNNYIALNKHKKEELKGIEEFLFPNFKEEFRNFFYSFLNDEKTFVFENEKILKEYDNFELKKLKATEALYIFGDNKQKLCLTDWKGEENEKEIESFLESNLSIKTDWKNVNELRKNISQEKSKSKKFITELLKAIDIDLKPLNKRLIFINLGWDAYVYTVIEQTSYNSIINKFGKYFYGSDKI